MTGKAKRHKIMDREAPVASLSIPFLNPCTSTHFFMVSGVERIQCDLVMPLNSSLHLESMTECIVCLAFCTS